MAAFRVCPMSEIEAAHLCGWTYPPPYSMYDLEPGDEAMFLDPNLNYRAVRDGDALAGFACYGEDAQVIGGRYAEAALDIGCGMDPARVGHGQGAAFVAAILDYACATWAPALLRLSVATFNRRAIAVYRRAGFRAVECFVGTTRGGTATFQTMTRPAVTVPTATSPRR